MKLKATRGYGANLGRWIDSLTDEQRDRIVRATNWTYGSWLKDGASCVVGHAYHDFLEVRDGVWMAHLGHPDTGSLKNANAAGIPSRFDVLVIRFGLDRIVRLVKLRAGADLSDAQPAERSEAAVC